MLEGLLFLWKKNNNIQRLKMKREKCINCGTVISDEYRSECSYGGEISFCSDKCYEKYHGFKRPEL